MERLFTWTRTKNSSLVLVQLPLIDISKPPEPKLCSPTCVEAEPFSCADPSPQPENPRAETFAQSTRVKVECLSDEELHVSHSYMSTSMGLPQESSVKEELTSYEEQHCPNPDASAPTPHTQYLLTCVKEEPLSPKDNLPHPDDKPVCPTNDLSADNKEGLLALVGQLPHLDSSRPAHHIQPSTTDIKTSALSAGEHLPFLNPSRPSPCTNHIKEEPLLSEQENFSNTNVSSSTDVSLLVNVKSEPCEELTEDDHKIYHVQPTSAKAPEASFACQTGSISETVHTSLFNFTGQTDGVMFLCDQCGKCFQKQGLLTAHHKTHSGQKRFDCQDCGKRFLTKSHLVVHKRSHTGEKPFPCLLCGKQFAEKGKLRRHERSHSGKTPYNCSECGKCFMEKSKFGKHLFTHQAEKYMECPKSFPYNSKLADHQSTQRGKKLFECSDCEKCFHNSKQFAVHQRIHTSKKLFECEMCQKRFTQKGRLVNHQRSHTAAGKCGKLFAEKGKLSCHASKKEWRCSECGKDFLSKLTLKAHQRLHTKAKPYECLECGRCYTYKLSFTKHMNLHSQINRYACTKCERVFSEQENLDRHYQIHTSEKRFNCPECKKSYSDESSLAVHLRRHTGERPYVCSECGKAFCGWSSLGKHKQRHKNNNRPL